MAKKGSFPKREGRYIVTVAGGEEVRAYLPPPLPPDPPLQLGAVAALLEEANIALGRLDGVASILPDTPLFLYMYVRKEALLSSQIEGTQSSLSDLLLYESDEVPGVPIDDVEEVSNYVAAMNHGLSRLEGGFPLSLRLIREIHDILLTSGRGAAKQPGEFRRSQNWVGGSRPGNAVFVPPPANQVLDLMSDLEGFIHTESAELPLLIKSALAHVQFETIHPFLDGNGRLGRLLITFMLCAEGALRYPVLYLSLYFKSHRDRYYELLQQVRDEGVWEDWLEFFLIGVKTTSDQAAETAKELLELFDRDRSKIDRLGRAAGSALRVHQYLQTKPLLSVPSAARELKLSAPTVRKSVLHLVDLGIVNEVTGRQRGQVFAYKSYLEVLGRGTEPL